ncbi:hypothetical protein C7408_13628 [Paraburkholderia caballeronis]|nr:hypothetical protein C7408_13628 [Paraburkholderia caballeronis]
MTLVGQIQCTDSTRWSVQREFNRRVLDRFAERGIELANPQRNFIVGLPGGNGDAAERGGDAERRSGDGRDDRDAEPGQAGHAGQAARATKDAESPSGSTTDARGTSPGSKPSL